MIKRRAWNDVSTATRKRIVAMGFIQFTLLVAALWDISHRKPEEIRGNKKLWYVASFINFVGPISYFIYGRNRESVGHEMVAD